jgi:hypothetical protein
MVPTSLILAILVFGFLPGTFAYLFGAPKRRIVNEYFIGMGGCGAFMIFTIALPILGVHVVWLSWVQLMIAILLVSASVLLLRKGWALSAARDRATAERRAKGR